MTLTSAEKAYFDRMVPHIVGGKSFVEAARAVLEDDERLWLTAMANDDIGAAIREEMGRKVYETIRGGK